MRAEKYLLQHIRQHNISVKQIEKDTGINLETYVQEGRELLSDDFCTICIYLGISADEVSDQIL